jgi:lysophosphatidic acid acyltransferase/lysophosphatidylinositol acyltransferase
MHDFVPAIYGTTVIIPKDSPAPTMQRILKGQSSVVSVSIFKSCGPELLRSDQFLSSNFNWLPF